MPRHHQRDVVTVLLIDPPVTVFSPVEDVRAWQRELVAIRAEYAGDPDALRCIARAERDAEALLALIPTLPAIQPPPHA